MQAVEKKLKLVTSENSDSDVAPEFRRGFVEGWLSANSRSNFSGNCAIDYGRLYESIMLLNSQLGREYHKERRSKVLKRIK